MSDQRATLQKMIKSKFFQSLSVTDVEGLFRLGEQVTFAAGETLITEGEEGDHFYCILEGRVSVTITSLEGKSVELVLLKDGDLLGEMVLLGKKRRTATATAHSDCKVLAWKCADCLRFFEIDTRLGFRLMTNFAQILSDRIHSMNLQVRNSATTPPAQDILKLLRTT